MQRLFSLYAMAIFFLLAHESIASDTLERIRKTGVFTFGADQEGGGPFIYPDSNDSSVLKGFEYDLAKLIAGDLSRQLKRPVEAQFSQSPWEMLPSLLNTHRIDLILNGYEPTSERSKIMLETRPYYVYALQLMARIDDKTVMDWESLKNAPRKKIGVLGGSSAELYAREYFKNNDIEIVLYDGSTNAMLDVTRGKLDATLQDTPIAIFYQKDFPSLKFVGSPVAPASYVMFVRLADKGFLEVLDRAITNLREQGALKGLYERYGIWTAEQERRLASADSAPQVAPSTKGNFFKRHGWVLIEAAGITMVLAFWAMPLAILAGILIALGRLFGPKWLSVALHIYVEIIRGTPLLLQLLFIFYLLPAVGINMGPMAAAIFGLAINYSAYEAEIYRAGLLAIPKGQTEAALTLGMTKAVALRRIILPQAMRVVLPPVTNDFIALFKDTSVCSVVTVVELAKRYNIEVMNHPAELVPIALVTALLYLCMSFPLSVLSRRMEAKSRQ